MISRDPFISPPVGGPGGEMIVNENPIAAVGRGIAINPGKDKHCGRPREMRII